MLIYQLYIFFEVSVQSFFPHFLTGLFKTLLGFKNSLYILDTSPSSNVLFANTFSQSVTYLFIFLTGFSQSRSLLLFQWTLAYPFFSHLLCRRPFYSPSAPGPFLTPVRPTSSRPWADHPAAHLLPLSSALGHLSLSSNLEKLQATG